MAPPTAAGFTWRRNSPGRRRRPFDLDPRFRATVDGAVYGQPLYWIPPGGGAARIIVATENNKVYALERPTGARIWERSLGDAGSALGAAMRQHRPNGRHRHADDRSGRPGSFISKRSSRRQPPGRATGVRPFSRHGQSGAGLAGRRRERASLAGTRFQQRAPRAA